MADFQPFISTIETRLQELRDDPSRIVASIDALITTVRAIKAVFTAPPPATLFEAPERQRRSQAPSPSSDLDNH